jgi:hypothetical protein
MKYFLISTFATLLFVSCGNKEQLTSIKGEEIIIEHCSGEDFLSDSKTFRYSSTGTSPSRETAKKIARQNAESGLARQIESVVELVAENQATQLGFNTTEEATSKFNEFTRTIVNTELKGAIDICGVLTSNESGKFTYYIAIELSGEKIASKYQEKLSESESIRADYNYEKFKDTFEEVMESYRN